MTRTLRATFCNLISPCYCEHAEVVGSGADYFVLPTLGAPATRRWTESSSGVCPGVLVAAGQYDMAMHVLYSQAAIVNFAPLKPLFALTHQAAYAYVSTVPNLEATVSPIFAVC